MLLRIGLRFLERSELVSWDFWGWIKAYRVHIQRPTSISVVKKLSHGQTAMNLNSTPHMLRQYVLVNILGKYMPLPNNHDNHNRAWLSSRHKVHDTTSFNFMPSLPPFSMLTLYKGSKRNIKALWFTMCIVNGKTNLKNIQFYGHGVFMCTTWIIFCVLIMTRTLVICGNSKQRGFCKKTQPC